MQFQDANGVWRTIIPPHIKALQARGITPKTATESGIYSETSADEITKLLNTKALRQKNMPCMVISFSGDYCRVRRDNPRSMKDKPVKYESPCDRGQRVYLPLDVANYATDATQELVITEGELKAIAATQEGFPTIGLVGVMGWKETRREELISELRHFTWPGHRVYLVFDSDRTHKPQVQQSLARLAKILTDAGAIVQDVHLPDGPLDASGNPTKQGISSL